MEIIQSDQKVHFFKTYFKVLKSMHRKNPRLLPAMILANIAMVIISIFPVIYQKVLVNNLLNPGSNLMHQVAIYAGVLLLANVTFELIYGYTKNRFSLVRLDFMADQYYKYLSMDYDYYENTNVSAATNRAMEATRSNSTGFEGMLHEAFRLPSILISLLILVVLLCVYVPILIPVILMEALVLFWCRDRTRKAFFDKEHDISKINNRYGYLIRQSTDFAFAKDLRIYGLSSVLLGAFERELQNLMSIWHSLRRKEFSYAALSSFVVILCDGVLFMLLLRQGREGMNLSSLVMLLTAAVSLSLLLRQTIDALANLVGEVRIVQYSYEFLEAPLNKQSGSIKDLGEDPLKIEFQNVSFAYPNKEEKVLDQVSFIINPGEKLALVGINGAGKTTLVKLLTGLYQPTEGTIRINDRPLADYDQKALFRSMACVFQDLFLLPFDVATNVSLKEENSPAQEKKIWDSLKMSGLASKIQEMPKGLQQTLDKQLYKDAIQLSGGEMQKLIIARSIYKNSPMIILDEPTSALDALAEEEIYRKFNDLTKEKTALFISHRLASTSFCDRIILLGQGGILEEGSHDELMAKAGQYHHMFQIQAKYYQEEAHE